jgi:hypothetical protein
LHQVQGSYFVPELNDTADITERISQAKAIRLHEQAITGQQKIPIDIRRRLYQVDCEYNLGSESWALKEADRSKLEAFHHGCSPMHDDGM